MWSAMTRLETAVGLISVASCRTSAVLDVPCVRSAIAASSGPNTSVS